MEHISIVGAGLVGSLLSIYLAQKGYSVQVFERRSDPRVGSAERGRSINLALSERGWRALEEVGMAEEIRKQAIPMRGRMIHDLEGNLNFQPYGKDDQAIYSVSRSNLNLSLIQKAASFPHVEFHFETRCNDLDLRQKTLLLEKNGQETKVSTEVLLGTDGAFSAVRMALQKTDRFDYSQTYLSHGYKELSILPSPEGMHRLEKNALHIWPRQQFMLIALPNIDGSFTCTLFLALEGEVSFANLQTESQIMAFFKKYFADTIPLIPNLVQEFTQNPTSSLLTVRCSKWAHEQTAVLGDAAHAIVPFYGQGMNAGFEDCRVLNELLEKQPSDWHKILQVFQNERVKNANAIADLALRNFIEMRDSVIDEHFLLRKKIEAHIHTLFPERWIPLYTMVTFSHIPYSEALRIGRKQDEIMAKVLKREGIFRNWKTLDFEAIVQELEK